MYEGPAAQTSQSAEEYLLGKIYKGSSEPQEIQHTPMIAKPNLQWQNKVMSKNDTFTRLHEDPMLMIRQTEKKVFLYLNSK